MRKVLIVLLLVSCGSAQTLISGRRRTLQTGGVTPPAAGLSYVTSCTGTTSCTPSGTLTGDLYIIAVGRDLSTTAPTNPSTPQTSTAIGTAQTINGTSTADSYFQIFCKVAAGANEATGTWTSASGITVTAYRNTLATTTAGCATDAFGTPSKNTTAINTTTTTVTYNSITNGSSASWDLGFAYAPAATVGLGTAPTSMTNRALQGSTKVAAHDTNASVSSWTTANVTVTTAGRVMTTTVELKAPVAATPSLTPSSGTPPQSVTLASATTGSGPYIYYTTNGVDPTSGDTNGTSVSVSTDPTTVKAKVISMPGWTDSAVGSGVYTSSAGFIGPALLDDFNTTTYPSDFTSIGTQNSAHWTCSNGVIAFAPSGADSAWISFSGAGRPGGGASACYWNSATFGPNTEVALTMTSAPALSYSYSLCARYNISTNQGYCLNVGVGASATPVTWKLTKDSPLGTALVSGTQTMASGNKIGLKVNGTTVSAWFYNGSWSQILTTTDATYDGTGSNNRIVIHGETSSPGVDFDDFSGATQ